jgi:peptidyl carrier protein
MSGEQSRGTLTTEEKISQIWQSVLAASRGDRDATFFELGGESISAVRIVSQVEEELGIEVDVASLFEEDPTLADFIRMVSESRAG